MVQRTESGTRLSSVRPRVLLVDDEPAVLLTTAMILQFDYDVVTASDGEQAYALLAKPNAVFDAVCSDCVMPKMDGVELLERVAALPSFTARVLITGQREHCDRWEERQTRDLYYVLLKPYAPEQLIDVLRRAVAHVYQRRKIGQARVKTVQSVQQVLIEPKSAARDSDDRAAACAGPPRAGVTGLKRG